MANKLCGDLMNFTQKMPDPFVEAKRTFGSIDEFLTGDGFLKYRNDLSELSKAIKQSFYKKCEDNNIPILAHCAPEGIVAHGAESKKYREFNVNMLNARLNKSKERGKKYCTNHYSGKERAIDNNHLDYFYKNYGHPRNWIPVLEHCPKLRLCLAGFGGNGEWQDHEWRNEKMSKWAKAKRGELEEIASLPSQWIRCIIKLTAKYENVYADISGLNIGNPTIRDGVMKMLRLIQDNFEEFGHLKHKLIFGSGWYLTEHNYIGYCHNNKKFFREVEAKVNDELERVAKGKTDNKIEPWKLWEYVSLINPWKFYVLDKTDRIKEIHDTLQIFTYLSLLRVGFGKITKN
jgi:hypothetical protein